MSDPNLTLHYHFSKGQTLVADIGPTLDITRATSATFVNASGLIDSVASGVARFGHNPLTKQSLGLLVEEARTNIVLQSEALFSIATWGFTIGITINTNVETSPNGAVTADTLDDISPSILANVNQAITIANDSTTYVISVFVKKGSASILGVDVDLTGGTLVASKIRFQPSTGSFSSDSAAGAEAEEFDDYFRLRWTFTNNTTGNITLTVRLFPAVRSTLNGADDATATGSNTFWGVDIQIGTFPTSYIPTTTTAVTRNADVVGVTDASWLNVAAGTLYTESILGPIASMPNGSQRFCGIDDGTNVNRIIVRSEVTSGVADMIFLVRDTSVNQAVLTDDTNYIDGQNVKSAVTWQTNDFRMVNNGGTALTDSSGIIPPSLTTLHVGVNEMEDAGFFNGHIAELRYYNVRKSNDFLDALSNGQISEDDTDIGFITDVARSLARNLARQL